MAVAMDKNLSSSSGRELAERLFKKNVELENGLRKSAQSKIPSDPNTWIQMRENYEAIILEDHEFSEQKEVEFLLWQLHYRRIEEFRSHLNAVAHTGVQEGKVLARSDRLKKIRSVFKSFLSEATGFYHDLILKIRSKYGLPLGFFSEGPENQIALIKDAKKLIEMKKGLLSCHRCLIYLGDLSRYKGLYGEGDSGSREYAASSSYYIQAASLWPSSGNPHHQLAILASYSGNDLLAVYRYFRSLAVDSPFSKARDNLIIAFEKNRQNYTLLPSKAKVVSNMKLPTRPPGRGRGRDSRVISKDTKAETTPILEQELSTQEILKAFSIRFVRLNGILFTRTSLETFGEIFSLVTSDMNELLSSGPEEELNFGVDAAENGLFIMRLIAILIFTVHNVNRESEGQSYAEILQRQVLLPNAFTSAFEFVGHILKRCVQLQDVTSSYLLPAILVFIEWLACHPDIAAGFDIEERQASARSFFWNQFVSFLNKLMLSGLASLDNDEDENCFSDISQCDDEEMGNRHALWEDFELRGFSPLVPAQQILDFSKKQSFGGDVSNKDKKARVQRILAAGRALMSVVRVDQKGIYFDSNMKKFMIALAPLRHGELMSADFSSTPELNVPKQESPVSSFHFKEMLSKAKLHSDGEDEEEIVFKPTLVYPSTSSLNVSSYETIHPVQNYAGGDWPTIEGMVSAPLSSIQMSTALTASYSGPPKLTEQTPYPTGPSTFNWQAEQEPQIYEGLRNLNVAENGWFLKQGFQEGARALPSNIIAPSFLTTSGYNSSNILPSQVRVQEDIAPSMLESFVSSGMHSGTMPMNPSVALPTVSRKNPVSRPVRHLGPPPGFSHLPSKQPDEPIVSAVVKEQGQPIDDYSWLDGHKSSKMGIWMENSTNQTSHMYSQFSTGINDAPCAMDFPFPGKQVSPVQTSVANEKWQDFQLFDQLKQSSEKQLCHANAQIVSLPVQHQAQSFWSGNHFV